MEKCPSYWRRVEGYRKMSLLGQNCKITVVSDRINSNLRTLYDEGKINLIKQKIIDTNVLDNFKDVFLVLAATDDKDLNRKIVEKGNCLDLLYTLLMIPMLATFPMLQ
jgi:precorrin-2 dehydrogenase/sirohydrochlorin ferrochelatase